jgi:phosphate starvation-inducible PhoH-like protein
VSIPIGSSLALRWIVNILSLQKIVLITLKRNEMSKQAVRHRRDKLVEDSPKPSPKEKFLKAADDIEVMQQAAVPKFEAKTPNQKVALSMLREGRSVVFLTGSAGVGKSMLAAYDAATRLKSKQIEKIYLIRPAVAVGKSVGLLPGDLDQKLMPYFMQTIIHLEKFMGKGYLHYCMEHDIVSMQPAEFLRGMSFENCVVVAEECQNFTKEEFEMVLTRLGNNCYLRLTGDTKQHDLKGGSGMDQTIEMLERMVKDKPHYLSESDNDAIAKEIGVVKFLPSDVVRSGLTKAFVTMYYNNQ